MKAAAGDEAVLVSTGVAGLDEVLGGGLTPHRLYLVEGNPGSGKSTLALQYLLEGARRGEMGVYVTLSETREELKSVARSHGWSLDGIDIVELTASERELEPDNQYTMFQPSEVELGVTTREILSEVERVKPARVVIDSLSELRLLAQNPLRYRRQILALKHFFTGRACTVLLADDQTSEAQDLQLESLAHGVLSLEQLAPGFGAERRRLRVIKLRGQKYRGGYHDFVIRTGGLEIFPRLTAGDAGRSSPPGVLRAGIPQLDALLGGGVDFGTSLLLVGPAGCGKSSLAVQFAHAAAAAGESAALYIFDEREEVLRRRAAGLGTDLTSALKSGRLTLQTVDPAELSPGEFSHAVLQAVGPRDGSPGARVVVIDSLNGYLHSMPEERFLTAQLHELLTYLGHRDVVTILVLAQHGLVASSLASIDTTYLADTVVLFRHFEAAGEVRQAISVVKKRSGTHERTIRELRLDGGIHLGPPLSDFQGVLTGTPQFFGPAARLQGAQDE